jgi:hypothetical protein
MEINSFYFLDDYTPTEYRIVNPCKRRGSSPQKEGSQISKINRIGCAVLSSKEERSTRAEVALNNKSYYTWGGFPERGEKPVLSCP